MKVQLLKPVEIDIRSLLKRTTGTINRAVRGFCKGTLVPDERIDPVLARMREVRILIRNDADATLRMITMRPEREDEYRELWAACANKLMDECCGLLVGLFPDRSAIFDEESCIKSGMMESWASPAPKQKDTPTPLESASKKKEGKE